MSKGSGAAVRERRRKQWRKRNKKLKKKHEAFVRIAFRDNHNWAIYRELWCTHRKCGLLGPVGSAREGRRLARNHERAMALKKVAKRRKKESKVGHKLPVAN